MSSENQHSTRSGGYVRHGMMETPILVATSVSVHRVSEQSGTDMAWYLS